MSPLPGGRYDIRYGMPVPVAVRHIHVYVANCYTRLLYSTLYYCRGKLCIYDYALLNAKFITATSFLIY